MLEWYNNLALYSLSLLNNGYYILYFALVCTILGFFISFILLKFDEDFKDSFWSTFGMSLLITAFCGLFGFLLAIIWSIFLFYIIPFIISIYLLFKWDKIVSWIKNKFNQKSKSKIVKKVIDEIKCEELARHAYENLKKDFPDIKYEAILENIKGKL